MYRPKHIHDVPVRLTDEQHESARQLAAADDVSMAHLFRGLLTSELAARDADELSGSGR